MSRAPLVIAHRGLHDAHRENSLAAFQAAIAAGADGVELDVRATADEALVVLHDATIAGVPLASLRRDELATAAGFAPPLLADVLDACAGRTLINVELKERACAADAIALLRDHAGDGLVVSSFHDDLVALARERLPGTRAGLLLGAGHPPQRVRTRTSELWPGRRARACGASLVIAHRSLAALDVLRRAHAAGLETWVWAAEADDVLRRHLGDRRVGAVICDRVVAALAIRGVMGCSGP